MALKKIKMCINPKCGNCGWEIDTNEKRCGSCRKRLVIAKRTPY